MERLFKTAEWARNTNIYEVNTRQYTSDGTFSSFSNELPRLRKMGVGTIWFMPITPISKTNRKGTLGSYYACSDYRAINPEFGTLEDFKDLVKKAKESGFRVIIDWVANHTGWDHVWTISNPEFYVKDENNQFRPPFPEWSDTLQLDYTNQGLRRTMIEAMKFWIRECDIDGFRCDMAHLVPLDFWIEARTELDRLKELFWLAETEEVNYHAVFDASYAWEFLHTMEKYWRKEIGMNELDIVLHKYNDRFPDYALRAFFTSNHDENSHSGSEYERMGKSAVPFAVLCATWSNSVPLIYSGQEMPLMNKRLQFFERDAIPWTGNYELEEFYRLLFLLRLQNPALRAGDPRIRTFRLDSSRNDIIFSFLRKVNSNEVLVVLNLSSEDAAFTLKGRNADGEYNCLFLGDSQVINSDSVYELPAWGFEVYYR